MVEEIKKSKWGIWKYILIVIIIFIGYEIFLGDNNEVNNNSRQDIIDNIKSHIVYVLYDFSGKNGDGSYFEKEASGSGVIFYTEDSMMQIFTNRHVIDCGYTDSCYQRIKEIVKVRMPDQDMYVLMTNAKWSPEFYEGTYFKDKNIFETCNVPVETTHWLPIPNPPNQG